jgi:hypothetical protein
MRKTLIVVGLAMLLAVPALAVERTFTWTVPTAYTDNTPVGPESSSFVYHLYVDGQKFATTFPGETTWAGTIPQKSGESKTYQVAASVGDGEVGPKSDPLVYLLMLTPGRPSNLIIQLPGP